MVNKTAAEIADDIWCTPAKLGPSDRAVVNELVDRVVEDPELAAHLLVYFVGRATNGHLDRMDR